MYLVARAATFYWAVALWFIFPETPSHSHHFSPEEQTIALERTRANNSGGEHRKLKPQQVLETFLSYHFLGEQSYYDVGYSLEWSPIDVCFHRVQRDGFHGFGIVAS